MGRGYLVFGDIEGKLDVLRIECTRCPRKGSYSVRRLVAQHGRDGSIMVWKEGLNRLSENCAEGDVMEAPAPPTPARRYTAVEGVRFLNEIPPWPSTQLAPQRLRLLPTGAHARIATPPQMNASGSLSQCSDEIGSTLRIFSRILRSFFVHFFSNHGGSLTTDCTQHSSKLHARRLGIHSGPTNRLGLGGGVIRKSVMVTRRHAEGSVSKPKCQSLPETAQTSREIAVLDA
jgi:hypothetical protein